MATLARHGNALVLVPALQYATEVRDLFFCVPRPNPFAPGELASLATSADLVLFVKTGCGFCKAAKASTASLVDRRNVVPLDSVEQRRALAAALGLPTVTVPVVFVRGRCGGDGEALRALLATPGMLEARMDLPMEASANRITIGLLLCCAVRTTHFFLLFDNIHSIISPSFLQRARFSERTF
jgi:glutaredoxin